MNILQLAKEHCANYQNGICTGVDIQLDGTAVRFLPEGSRCLYSVQRSARAHYLEESVLPDGEMGLDCDAYDAPAASRGTGFQGRRPSLPDDASRFSFSTSATEVPRLSEECIASASTGL